jgi:hypothetical protein
MKPLNLKHPALLAFITCAVTLIGGATLIGQAHFGVSPILAVAALLWFSTLGLPTVLGVACVATVWGRLPGLHDFTPFAVCASVVALCFQYLACRWVWNVRNTWLNRRSSA